MAKPLSHIQDILTFSIFECIRLECVDQGYLPDITAFPDTSEGYTDYKAATALIAQTKGFSIEVFSNSNPQDKGHKKAPRIVIVTGGFMEGSIGLSPSPTYIPNTPTSFISVKTPPLTSDLPLRIYLVANSDLEIRTLSAILTNSITNRGYVSARILGYSDEPFEFFIRRVSSIPLPNAVDELIEIAHEYIIEDLLEIEQIPLDAFIAAITELIVEVKWGEESTVLISIKSSSCRMVGVGLLHVYFSKFGSCQMLGVGHITFCKRGKSNLLGEGTLIYPFKPAKFGSSHLIGEAQLYYSPGN